MTDASSHHGLDRIVFLGKVRKRLLVAILGGLAIIAAFAAGRHAEASAPSQAARAPTQASAPATVATGIRVLTAPATDSLHAAILDSSSADLAPGSSLSVAQAFTNEAGKRQWEATLSGTARFTIRDKKSDLAIRAEAGHVTLPRGTYEVNATPAALTVHTIAGETALLYKPHGIFSWVARKVPPDDVGIADQAHAKMRVTRQR